MLKSYGAATAPSHCTIYYYNCYNYYIIIIIIVISKGYFSVNQILSFCSFESKNSVVVDVVIAAKHLSVANRIYILNSVFILNFYQQSITNNESCGKL